MERRGAIDPSFIARFFLILKCIFLKTNDDSRKRYNSIYDRFSIEHIFFMMQNILRSKNTGSDDSQTRYWILDVSLKLQCMCAYIWDRLRVLYVIFTFSVARHTLDVFLLHEKCQYLGGYITFCIDEIQ